MPTDGKKNGHDAYRLAYARVMSYIVPLVQVRGVPVGVDIDSRRDPSESIHQIQLTYGRRTRLVSVGHDTFMNAEFFRALVLPEVEAAIDELASSQQKAGSSMSKSGDTRGGEARVPGHPYFVAYERVLKSVVRLVDARGLAMNVDVDPGRAPSQATIDAHHIQLTYGRSMRVIAVDHDTFMNAEFFKTLVLHQVQAVIAELAWSQDTSSVDSDLQSLGT